MTTTGKGKVYQTPFLNLKEDSGDLYGIHDGPLIKGCRVGRLSAVTAVLSAFNAELLLGHTARYCCSVRFKRCQEGEYVVPYSIIMREWRMFQAQLDGKNGPAGPAEN